MSATEPADQQTLDGFRFFSRWILQTDWRLRAAIILLGGSFVVTWLWAKFGPWHHPFLVVCAAFVACGCGVLLGFERSRKWLGQIDWRISAILLATAASVVATLIGFDFNLHEEATAPFLRDVFAAWLGGVAFFIIVGIVVAVVSIARPEAGTFESRARILFRGQSGKHIEYIVGRIKEIFEQYAVEVIDTITILDHKDGKFFLSTESKTKIRGYIGDITSTYASRVAMTETTDSPDTGRPNRLTFLCVGNQNFGSKLFTDGALLQPFQAVIEPGEVCTVSYGLEFWVKEVDEPNSFEPARYTRRIKVVMRNHLPGNQDVRIKIAEDGSEEFHERLINPGGDLIIYEGGELRPGHPVYDYRLST